MWDLWVSFKKKKQNCGSSYLCAVSLVLSKYSEWRRVEPEQKSLRFGQPSLPYIKWSFSSAVIFGHPCSLRPHLIIFTNPITGFSCQNAGVRMCDKELEKLKEEERRGRVRGGCALRYHNVKSKFKLSSCVNKLVVECLFSPSQQREAGSTGTPGPPLPSA